MGDPTPDAKAEPIKVKANTVTQVPKDAPKEYWKALDLHLCCGDKSVDKHAAKNGAGKATVDHDYIKQLQADLKTLGYLDKAFKWTDGIYDEITARAVWRFRRHARRTYRMKGTTPDDVKPADVFVSKDPQSDTLDGELPKEDPDTGEKTTKAQKLEAKKIALADKTCEIDTATEIRKWIDKGWKLPLGRIKQASIITDEELADGLTNPSRYKLREDAAEAWKKIVAAVRATGARIGFYPDDHDNPAYHYATVIKEGVRSEDETKIPYTDAPRRLSEHGSDGSGASKKSFHFTSRAVDLAQYRTNGSKGDYFLVEDPPVDLDAHNKPVRDKQGKKQSNGTTIKETFWTIWCRVAKNGPGVEVINGEEIDQVAPPGKDGQVAPAVKVVSPWKPNDPTKKGQIRKYINVAEEEGTHGHGTYHDFPAGYYVNITAIITILGGHFERIKAHANWEKKAPKHQEWWHFQYTEDPQLTFLDHCELVGHTQKDLLDNTWTMAEMDGHAG